ncbi:MAG: FHA domain-containing protein [Kiritimatiellae bacterium]|nr:FHA domain-containing protein [Kiritimatiellia bacterium]
MAEQPELMVLTGANAGKRFAVGEKGIRLGRSSANDIHEDDLGLSRTHCIFERDGESGVAVIDLASANGTFVNGEQLGCDRRVLKPGDVVEAGDVRLRVMGAAAQPSPARGASAVDLGLGASKSGAAPAAKPAAPRKPAHAILLVAVAAIAIAAVAVLFFAPVPGELGTSGEGEAAAETVDELVSFEYEKVDATASRLFRYDMTIDGASGMLHVVCDDVPVADRHIDKSAKLDPDAVARVMRTLDECGWEGLDDSYAGSPADGGNALRLWRMRAVRRRTDGSRVKEVVVENTVEPVQFSKIREALEAFSKNELGIWAVEYSVDRLLELSAQSAKLGDLKFSEKDVEYGNLSAAIDAYKEALFYLETVNPKPASFDVIKTNLKSAAVALDEVFQDHRILADKAMGLGNWDEARRELRILCALVPDRRDPRNVAASENLVDVETRSESEEKGGSR